MSTVANRTSSLNAAKAAKNDEFYAQWADIEREVNAYLGFDPDAFRDKVVLLPCDDPEWSNFAKFFALHFVDFGLKKLISTSYSPDSNPALFSYAPTLFEMSDPQFDETKTHANGKKFVLEPKDKCIAYERQTKKAKAAGKSNCPPCAIGGDSNKARIYKRTRWTPTT